MSTSTPDVPVMCHGFWHAEVQSNSSNDSNGSNESNGRKDLQINADSIVWKGCQTQSKDVSFFTDGEGSAVTLQFTVFVTTQTTVIGQTTDPNPDTGGEGATETLNLVFKADSSDPEGTFQRSGKDSLPCTLSRA